MAVHLITYVPMYLSGIPFQVGKDLILESCLLVLTKVG